MQKRSLSYTLTTLNSSLPSLLLGPGACHHPSPVSPYSVTDPSLYSAHNDSPPLVRSLDISDWSYAPALPSRPKTGPLFGLLIHTLMQCLLVPSAPNTHRHRLTGLQTGHTQGPFSTRTLGRGCHDDNRPGLLHPNPRASTTPPSLTQTRVRKSDTVLFQMWNV